MGAIVGIDLGTTYSAVATIDETGRPKIVHSQQEGQNITPSCVTVEEDGTIVVGNYALKAWGITPESSAARFKRDMGTSAKYTVGGQEFTPTELSAFVLKKLVQDTEAQIGLIDKAVVTVPANFAHEARDATMAAAKSAGLNVKYIINEPTAAALYYAFKGGGDLRGTFAVYDLGGGTFDVSIIRVKGQDIDVITSNGVSRLGGDDFDEALREIVSTKYWEKTNEGMESEDYTKNDSEEDKKSLSIRESVVAKVARESFKVSRKEFEEAISSKVTQAEMLCESAMEEAGVEPSDIRSVFLAGGSTRIPLVQQSIERVFQQKPVSTVNVDEVVALGAALYAAYKGDKSGLTAVQKNAIQKIKVQESTAKHYGTISLDACEVRGEKKLVNCILIQKNEKIPCSVTRSFVTTHDGQESVHCRVTESGAPETDPKFVSIVKEGNLELPSDRPAGQEIKITYAYDDNQMMECSFVDVGTGRKQVFNLSMVSEQDESAGIEKFTVE